jgi:hypothetical protein
MLKKVPGSIAYDKEMNRKTHNGELRNIYILRNIIRMIKPRRIGSNDAAHKGQMRNAHINSSRKTLRKENT